MKNLKNIFFLFIALGTTISTTKAQMKLEEGFSLESSYGSALEPVQSAAASGRNWGIGVRFGVPTALTLKHYTGNNAWELIVGSNIRDRIILQFHYLINNDISVSDNWKWYYGFGPQLQMGDGHDHDHGHNNDDHGHDHFGLGVDGVIGTEYRFDSAPFGVFLDLGIFVEILDDPFDIDLMSGLGVRYEF